jgi:acetolactate synthase-1/2/3 large subunit
MYNVLRKKFAVLDKSEKIMTMRVSGGEGIIRAVMANGVDTIFGIPGAQIYPLFDAMYRLGIKTIVTRHEQGAAYMALGYAKATGEPSAFAVVPGPGVLNTTAALCTAMGTCSPVLCLTGQVPSQFLGSGRGHLHELRDQPGTLRTLIKDAVRIDHPEQTQDIINDVLRTMLSGRPGPVSVEMCWDLMADSWDMELGTANLSVEQPEPDADVIDDAVKLLANSKRPMIMCGAGAQHAAEEVLQLAGLLDSPVTAFRSGRGVVSEDHELGVSSVAARKLWDDVDVLIGVGSRLEMMYMRWADMMKYDRKPQSGPKLIRIDIDPDEMRRFEPNIGIVADSALACRLLADKLETRVSLDKTKRERIAAAKVEARKRIETVQPQLAYLDVIREVLPRDGFFVPELCQAGFASFFGFPVYQPRTYVTEGHQGTLGFGFPTALGVKVARPDRAVVSVTGDGGFLFCSNELSTAVSHQIGLITLLFNNRGFENVRRDQRIGYDGRMIGGDLVNPDFMKLAESYDINAFRVDSPDALRPVLSKAIDADEPALIEIVVDPDSETSPWGFIHMPVKP